MVVSSAISGATGIVWSLFFTMLIIGAIAVVVYRFYIAKNKKKRTDDAARNSSEMLTINYDKFTFHDALEFAKFDDILDFGGMGIVATNNFNFFTAGVYLKGVHLDQLDHKELQQVMEAMVDVASSFDAHVTLYQSSQTLDLTKPLARHLKEIEMLDEKLKTLALASQEMSEEYQDLIADGSVPSDEYLKDKMQQLDAIERSREACINQRHMLQQICKRLERSTTEIKTTKRNLFLFSWQYRDIDYAKRPLVTPKERQLEAAHQLANSLSIIASSYARARVTVVPATVEDFMEEYRIINCPSSSSSADIQDLRKTTLFHPIVNAPTIVEAMKILNEMTEEEILEEGDDD